MKVGDKVRVIANLVSGGESEDLTGSEGEITEIYADWDEVAVRLKGDTMSMGFLPAELEVIEND